MESLKDKYPAVVEEIEKSLYVDDVISGGDTIDQVGELKDASITVFGEAGFQLHKWHSNVPELEAKPEVSDGGANLCQGTVGCETQ